MDILAEERISFKREFRSTTHEYNRKRVYTPALSNVLAISIVSDILAVSGCSYVIFLRHNSSDPER